MKGLINIRNKIRMFSDEDMSGPSYFKFKKYLGYAIGEVILLVFGIMIALYFNNLNELKRTRVTEIKILMEIQTNLDNTKEVFERALESENRYLQYNELILDYLDNKKPYSDSLDIAFGTYFWTISANPLIGGYEYLKDKGLSIISNDTLRQKISYMFESEFKIIKEENEIWTNNMQMIISYPYHITHFRKYFPPNVKQGDDEYAKPLDYNFLVEDEKFKNINAELISIRNWNNQSFRQIIVSVGALSNEIENEIIRLNKK